MKEYIYRIIGNKEDFSPQQRVFNSTLLAGIILNYFCGIINYILGIDSLNYLFPFVSSVVFIGLYIWAIYGRNFYLCSRITFVFTLFIYVPVSWFLNSGSLGGFQYFFVLFLLIFMTTMPRKNVVFVILYVLMVVTLPIIEYYYPDLIVSYSSRSERYIDIVVSHIFLLVCMYFVLRIFLDIYEKANNRLFKQKKELLSARKELEIKNKELIDISNTKDKFLSIIAHDLRGSFNSMLGFSNLLNENYDDLGKEEQKEYLDIIYKNINNTHKLLENLLIWSSSQKGNITFNPDKENLFLLSSEIVELMQFSANNKSIEIKLDIPKQITVNADKYMFSTILRNLLSNAVKFTPKGGEIVVKAREQGGDFVQIIVEDNGVGIPQDIQLKLFDISRSNTSRGTENESGTGLGLFLCKEFVEKHGGEISVESKSGKGSSFIYTIPLN